MTFFAPGIRRLSFSIVLFFASMGITTQAWASGDGGCTPVWRVVHRNYAACSNMAYLSPSNDTRVNLLLLIADLRAATPGSVKAGAPEASDPPLILWQQLVGRLGTTADKAALADSDQYGTAAPDGTAAPVAAALPANDPFTVAVQADHDVKPAERDALLAARTKVVSGGDAKAAASAVASAKTVASTAAAKAYALYLEGAAAFWAADYDKATVTFTSLATAQPATVEPQWVRETAAYMIGRSLINRAQVGEFDQYGTQIESWKADATIIAAFEAAMDKYLQQYPKGAYAPSARGLKRRGYWVAKDTAKLEAEYGALLLMSPAERGISDVALVQEIDNKLITPSDAFEVTRSAAAEDALLTATQNPLLLATLDLEAMRTVDAMDASDGEEAPGTPITMAQLAQQKPYFATQMPLYEYLLAAHAFYIDNKPPDVLRLLPDAARQSSFSYVQFSRQMLRGVALEAKKDPNTVAFFTQMIAGAKGSFERPAVELAIASHEERAGEVSKVFVADSPVHTPYMREVLLANVADATLLRAEATNAGVPQHERDIALFTLLYKEATRGYAADFLKDLALVPAGAPADGYFELDNNAGVYPPITPDPSQPVARIPLGLFLHDKTDATFACPGLRGSEEQLVKDANDPTAWLCVGEFVRLNAGVGVPVTGLPDELGNSPSMFGGKAFARMDAYTGALQNPKSSKNDKAYALYRAVNCYAPSGTNECGGKDVPTAQRKAWFTTLKRDYADTRWANALKFYW